MKSFQDGLKKAWTAEFEPILTGLSQAELLIFFERVNWFLGIYQFGYQLDRELLLVLDNSIVQDFKHKGDHKRTLRALAYVSFCRFVSEWSDRSTFLAVSPVLIYEHRGRKPSLSPEDAHNSLAEVRELVRDTGIKLVLAGSDDIESLHAALQHVHDDADFLEIFVSQIDSGDWARDLNSPHGGETPAIALADLAIPEDMPLKYFDPFYIRLVLRSRIEQLIADQSEGVFHSTPIRSGPISSTLAAMNEISKKGILKGLGDIDLLQICDVKRQYMNDQRYLFVGQSYDRNLADALRHHEVLIKSAGVLGGSKNVDQQIQDMLKLWSPDVFSEEDRRVEQIGVLMDEYSRHIAITCQRLSSL